MGFTQRQAGGKFTRDEAEAFIEQLETEIHGDGPPADSRPPAPRATAPTSKIAPRQDQPRTKRANPAPKAAKPAKSSKAAGDAPDLTDVPVEALAAELQRRGWVVLEP